MEKIASLKHSIRSGTYAEPSNMSLSEWMRHRLDDYKKQSLRPRTWESYNAQFENHIKPAIGSIKLTQLRTGDIQQMYKNKLKSGSRLDGDKGGLSPTTVTYIHRILHNCLEQAKKENIITANPTSAVVLPKKTTPTIKTLTAEEAKTLMLTTQASPWHCGYLLALYTGMRRGEVLALQWHDIDFDKVS